MKIRKKIDEYVVQQVEFVLTKRKKTLMNYIENFSISFEYKAQSETYVIKNHDNDITLSHRFQVIKDLFLKNSNFEILDNRKSLSQSSQIKTSSSNENNLSSFQGVARRTRVISLQCKLTCII